MRKEYDVIIVGGGPAGTTAAKYAAMNGAKVAVLEKDREIGIPVRCAEGTSKFLLEKYIGKEEIDEKWIAAEINKLRFISPSKYIVDVNPKQTGYVLNRRLFDLDLAERATEYGAEIYTKAYVYDIKREINYSRIFVKLAGKDIELKSKIIIAADGVESRIARFFGIDTTLSLEDIDTCAQMSLANIDIDPCRIDFYVSEKWAPGAYAWVFPKGKNKANVGLGLTGQQNAKKSALQYLQEFVDEIFPNASSLTTVAGGVPVSKFLPSFVEDGLMIVGDAARISNPLTGEGIGSALSSGTRAGKIAALAVSKNDYSKRFLYKYEKEWKKDSGRHQNLYYRTKDVAFSFSDSELDKLAEKFQGKSADDITLSDIFKTVVRNKPKLVLDVIKAFAGF